eukprot:TRINITY_DN239_c0_g1_i5.p1 TRINITY_DN239_c0_g1~~TRINITY_DN239_c0_g1_i5.p1  ORF type:complete len:2272 (+),score=570.58 TRINITY_DN239_c0_g1_i5:31-6816(+)
MSKDDEQDIVVPDVLKLCNSFASRYQLKKNNWYGTYSRVFCIAAESLLTLNPTTLAVTNLWEHEDIVSIGPVQKSDEDFTMTAVIKRVGRKTKTYSFTTPSRADLLCDIARLRYVRENKPANGAAPIPGPGKGEIIRVGAQKLKRSGEKRDIQLVLLPFAICQSHPVTGNIFAMYFLHQITRIIPISDVPGGFVIFYGTTDKRVYVFITPQRDALISKLVQAGKEIIGYNVPFGQESGVHLLTLDYITEHIRSLEADDQVYNTLAEFHVSKNSPLRHPDPQQRIMTLSDKWIVERHPSSYAVVTLRPLSAITALVRPTDDPQAFQIHYRDGGRAAYTCSYRDFLLSCLVDCGRAAGNLDIVITTAPPRRGMRLTPLGVQIDAETEQQILKAIADFNLKDHANEADNGRDYFTMLLATFNANVPYRGLKYLDTHRCYKVSAQALYNILTFSQPSPSMLQAVRRLTTTRPGYEAFTDSPPVRDKLLVLLEKALASNDEMITYTALDVMSSLMVPFFDPGETRTTDDTNKKIILGDEKLMNSFMKVFSLHVTRGTGALILMLCIEILNFILCEQYSETTSAEQFDTMLTMIAGLGRDLFKLFHVNHCLSVVRGAGMIMKSIIEEGSDLKDMVSKMQMSALMEGATLRHLHSALYTKNTNSRQIIFKALSCQLIELWTSGCESAESVLSRIFPAALLQHLYSKEEPPAEVLEVPEVTVKNGRGSPPPTQMVNVVKSFMSKWQTRNTPKRNPVVLRKRKTVPDDFRRNWPMLLFQFKQDHARADLVWNNHTREELREALESEIRVFKQEQEISSGGAYISWNHEEFIVPYDCLQGEINVGGYFLRLLLNPPKGQKAPPLRNPAEFFDMLFHRCLLEKEPELQSLCVQSLTVVYKFYQKDVGPFRDIAHIVTMLKQATHCLVRDRLLQFICVLLENSQNAKLFVDAKGIQLLTEILTLVHLQADHIIAPLASNLITAGPDMAEGEWYYSLVVMPEKTEENPNPQPKKERFGPKNLKEMKQLYSTGIITITTLCWAQGMEDWRPLQEVTQLKWALLGTGQSVFTNYELGGIVLDTFIKLATMYPLRDKDGGIIRPIPRPKRLLSSPMMLPHVVQVALTRDPTLVEKTAVLLTHLLEDNAAALPKLYLSGVFYFFLVYMGSNFSLITKFIKSTHLVQNFADNKSVKDIEKLSILGPLIPSAMVHLLERRGEEEFTRIFLGSYDTPEAIWNEEMRRFMVDKLSIHMGNFPQRLAVNPRAIYQYVPIAPIVYKNLDAELFCQHYYLRNLCDTVRFPIWPIDNEVDLLQSVITAWGNESDKAPPTLSTSEAIKILDLKPDYKDDELRRAYFKKAQKYHPDKNPEGREIFEKIHQAYTFLTTTTGEECTKERIFLIIRTQNMLYTRFSQELSPFKYAGYPLLTKTLQNAIACSDLVWLSQCCEMCYRTLKSSPLNVEELRRQGGIDMIISVMRRSIEALNTAKSSEDPQCLTAYYVLLTFSVAAAYEKCREIIVAHPEVVDDVCRSLQIKQTKINEAALECICSFSLDAKIQEILFAKYILHLVIPHLFKYDYTAEQAPENSPATPQSALNMNSGLALLAIGRLGGIDPASAVHAMMQSSVRSLLTPNISSQICEKPMLELLKDLNGNIETPLLIWNNRTRAELLSFLESSGPGSARPDGVEASAADAASFKFPSLEKEVKVGGVYLRVYNEQVKSHATLPDPKTFAGDLASYMGKAVFVVKDYESNSNPEGAEDLLFRLRVCALAMCNLLKANNGVEVTLANKDVISFLMSPFSLIKDIELQKNMLDMLSLLTRNTDCVNAIAEGDALYLFLPLLYKVPQCLEKALAVSHALLSNPKIVLSTITHGGLLYLIRLFSSATERGGDAAPRVQAAELLAKMAVDSVHGSRTQVIMAKFLPPAFIMTMKQEPESAVQMFEGTHENPDLIWNNNIRLEMRKIMENMASEFYNAKLLNPAHKFTVADDFKITFQELKDEVQIGGVYIRLFLKQPTWGLNDPKGFAEAIMNKYIETLTRPSKSTSESSDAEPFASIDVNTLKVAAKTGVTLFLANGQICDHIAKTGHLAKLISLLDAQGVPKHSSLLTMITSLMSSPLCIETAVGLPTVRCLVNVLRTNPKLAHPVCEAMEKMFTKNSCSGTRCFAKQVLETPAALKVLMKIVDGSGDAVLGAEASQAKARLVTGLQSLCRCESHGKVLSDELEKFPCWVSFGQQRQDLYITAGTGPVGLLTGPANSVVGLIADVAHNSSIPYAPPSLE